MCRPKLVGGQSFAAAQSRAVRNSRPSLRVAVRIVRPLMRIIASHICHYDLTTAAHGQCCKFVCTVSRHRFFVPCAVLSAHGAEYEMPLPPVAGLSKLPDVFGVCSGLNDVQIPTPPQLAAARRLKGQGRNAHAFFYVFLIQLLSFVPIIQQCVNLTHQIHATPYIMTPTVLND